MMSITDTEMLIRLGVAIALGGAIGYERELREQPAGLRTHILVALASATFSLVSFHVEAFQNYKADGLIRMDTGRIASNIVVGIGFLGGFLGPMILTPDANQGPMLGIFITGPLGGVAGAIGGALVALLRKPPAR